MSAGSRIAARASAAWARFDLQGSTRSAALLRIGLAAVALAQLGGEVQLFAAPDALSAALGLSFYLSVPAMLVGYRTRLATAWAAATLVATYHHRGHGLGEVQFVQHQSWLLAISVCFLALTPSGRSFSVDRWLRLRRLSSAPGREARDPAARAWEAETGSLWGLRLAGLQVSLVYLFGAIHKTNPAFLRGDRLEQMAMSFYLGSEPAPEVLVPLLPAAAASVVFLEYALSIGLWIRRARRALLVAGALMHVAFHVLLPVGTFSVLMIVLYVAFLDPAAVRHITDALIGTAVPGRSGAASGECVAG